MIIIIIQIKIISNKIQIREEILLYYLMVLLNILAIGFTILFFMCVRVHFFRYVEKLCRTTGPKVLLVPFLDWYI